MTSGTTIATEVDGLRPKRADARRNRDRVLVAAEEMFAAQGMSVPVDEIAKRAGVGVGTLYRHFPTKAALLEAVLLSHLAKFLERARYLSATTDATTALFTVVKELVQLAMDKKDLTEELARAGVGKEELHAPAKQELDALIAMLWEKARQEGKVRCDIGPQDVSSLIMATCMAADHRGHGSADMLVAVMCDGLRGQVTGLGPSAPEA